MTRLIRVIEAGFCQAMEVKEAAGDGFAALQRMGWLEPTGDERALKPGHYRRKTKDDNWVTLKEWKEQFNEWYS